MVTGDTANEDELLHGILVRDVAGQIYIRSLAFLSFSRPTFRAMLLRQMAYVPGGRHAIHQIPYSSFSTKISKSCHSTHL